MSTESVSAPESVTDESTALTVSKPVPMSPVLQRGADGTYTLRQYDVVISTEAAEALEDAAITAQASGLSSKQASSAGVKEYRAALRKALALTLASARANRAGR